MQLENQDSLASKSTRLLLCFMYDAAPFHRPPATAQNQFINQAANAAIKAGTVMLYNGGNGVY